MSLLAPQPPPVRAEGDVWRDVLASTWAPLALRRAMEERRAFGIQKHGTPVQVGNQRDARADAFQEMLDGIVYAEVRRQELALQVRHTAALGWRLARALFTLSAEIVRRLP